MNESFGLLGKKKKIYLLHYNFRIIPSFNYLYIILLILQID